DAQGRLLARHRRRQPRYRAPRDAIDRGRARALAGNCAERDRGAHRLDHHGRVAPCAGLRRHFRGYAGLALGLAVACSDEWPAASLPSRLSPLSTSLAFYSSTKRSRFARDAASLVLPLLGRFLPDLGPASAGLLVRAEKRAVPCPAGRAGPSLERDRHRAYLPR